MSTSTRPPDRPGGGPDGPGWRTLLVVLAFYAAVLLLAAAPAARRGLSDLAVAEEADPLQHLWTLRWYRDCLLEGRSPMLAPGLQHPVGSPLGLYSPLLLQGALYLALSVATSNDALLYNLILLAQFLFTGLGTFALAWHLLRHRAAAALSGLLAMLGGPMIFAAHSGGTELLSLGGFPLFLAGWMRFVDRPSRGGLAAAVGLFLLMGAGSTYYALMSVIPATLYVLHGALGGGLRGAIGWLRGRWSWLLGFGLLAALGLPLIVPAQLWAVAHGFPMSRSREHFDAFRASLWSYALPPIGHRLAHPRLPESWHAPGVRGAMPMYLGAATLALLAYGAAGRARFPRSGFLWLCLGVMVVLSLGAYAEVGGARIPLPALWLREHVPPFRAMRVPARYGSLGAVCAAVLAGGALAALLGRVRRRGARGAVVASAFALAIVDLSATPFASRPVPPMPPIYASLLGRDPGASLCEIHATGTGFDFMRSQAALTYWQAYHKGRTSAGLPGVENGPFSARSLANSPFHFLRLADPNYLAAEAPESFELIRDARFEDYAWLYLTALDYDYLVLHTWTWDGSPPPAPLLRIRERLAGAIVAEDAGVVVIDRRRIDPPAGPVAINLGGWRQRLDRFGAGATIAEREAEILVYNPDPGRPLRLELAAAAYREPREVRLRLGDRELARWSFGPGPAAEAQSPPFSLPRGLHALRLVSDGAARPRPREHDPLGGDLRPFSLWVSSLRIGEGPSAIGSGPGERARRR